MRWLVSLSVIWAVPACRLGYQILDDEGSVGLGGANSNGTGGDLGDGGSAPLGGASSGGTSGGASGGMNGSGGADTGGESGMGGMGGMTSTGGDGGSETACDPTAFFCSSFDDPLFSDWDGFDVQKASCIVETTSSPVLSESTSVRSYAPVGCDVARLNYDFDVPVTAGPLSLRGWFYLPSTVTLDDDIVIFELHDSTVGVDGKASINLGLDETVSLEVTTGISPRNSTSPSGIFARDAWNCAVLRTVVSDTSGSIEVEINGVTIHSLTAGDVFPEPGFARAIAGIYNYGSNEAEIFLDDVSLSQSALTCP